MKRLSDFDLGPNALGCAVVLARKEPDALFRVDSATAEQVAWVREAVDDFVEGAEALGLPMDPDPVYLSFVKQRGGKRGPGYEERRHAIGTAVEQARKFMRGMKRPPPALLQGRLSHRWTRLRYRLQTVGIQIEAARRSTRRG